jgi:hypothetical protein
VRIGFTRNGAVNTVTTSKIGFEQKPKYLERNPLLLKQRYGRQEQGGGSVKASVAHCHRFHEKLRGWLQPRQKVIVYLL